MDADVLRGDYQQGGGCALVVGGGGACSGGGGDGGDVDDNEIRTVRCAVTLCKQHCKISHFAVGELDHYEIDDDAEAEDGGLDAVQRRAAEDAMRRR